VRDVIEACTIRLRKGLPANSNGVNNSDGVFGVIDKSNLKDSLMACQPLLGSKSQ
jgi:hypothetical protein